MSERISLSTVKLWKETTGKMEKSQEYIYYKHHKICAGTVIPHEKPFKNVLLSWTST